MTAYKLARPVDLTQVSQLLTQAPSSRRLMAGGTDLLDEIKNGTVVPEMVIDLAAVPGLSGIRENHGALEVGAMTRVAELAENPLAGSLFPGLRQAALSLATPQLRNLGTVGGNLCQRPRCWYYRDPLVSCRKKGGARCFAFTGRNKYHAVIGGSSCFIVSPSDLAPMLAALGSEAEVFGPGGERVLPLEDFFILPRRDVRRENSLGPAEILTRIRIPRPSPGWRSVYLKFKERATWDFAVVSAAVSGRFSDGRLDDVRIVLGGVAPAPWRLSEAEARLRGGAADRQMVREAVFAGLRDARPLSENAYKLDLAASLVADAVQDLQ